MGNFKRGFKAGFPIGLGYLSVSFTFGIMAVSYGFYWWQALIISMANLTSAGQFAGIGIMRVAGQYLELFISQLTINIRYSFMSVSLTQKLSKKFTTLWRVILGFFMTDEIFAVASMEKKEITPSFFFGLSVLPHIGWSLGTLSGALLGSVLPHRLISALSLAIYGMFIAIISPGIKEERSVRWATAVAVLFSCGFTFLPYLSSVPDGISISICAVLSAVICAALFPVKEEDEHNA